MVAQLRLSIIGLGYVGLPLAVALARHFPATGFDIAKKRIAELKDGIDRTDEVPSNVLRASALKLTADEAELDGSDVFIVTVPTPVDDQNEPDLGAVVAACKTVGNSAMKWNTPACRKKTCWPWPPG